MCNGNDQRQGSGPGGNPARRRRGGRHCFGDWRRIAGSGRSEMLIRALANLVRNAIRYGAGAADTDFRHKGGGSVLLRVADSGRVSRGGSLKIFDAFYRADTSRTRETGGTGLGLTIVKTCIESCGGSVSAGTGSRAASKCSSNSQSQETKVKKRLDVNIFLDASR